MPSNNNNMFPALHPTPEQQAAYEKTAQQLLDATVQQYQVFNFHHRRTMSRKRWKPVKSREYLTVYKERDPQPAAHCDVGDDWKDPKLLVATGAIVGKLDDVMYGVVTPDAASMLLKASITKNRLIGGAVLNQIQGPTVHEPYRFLGIKWFVMAPPTTLNGMIWSRDLVFVEATGIKTLPNGERIGYQLMQSVDIPGYGNLENHSIMRGRISSCSVFKQLANGTVDVYVRGYVEAFGKVMDAVALKTAASGFLSSWNAVGCAQYKKLMWCVTHRHRRANSNVTTHNHRSCADCNKRFGAFSSAGMCILCKQWLCSKCRVVSKLRDVDAELGLEEKDAIICNQCVAHVDAQSTSAIATQEVRSGRFTPSRSKPIIKLWSFRRRNDSQSRDSVSLIPDQDEAFDDELEDTRDAVFRTRRAKSDGVQLFDPTQLYGGSKSRGHSSDSEPVSPEKVTQGYEFYDSGVTENADEPVSCYPLTPKQVHTMESYDYHEEKKPRSKDARQEQLWRQMLDLQAATEQIYQMTMHTTDSHLRRGASLEATTP